MNNPNLEHRLAALERAYLSLRGAVIDHINWQPRGCDDMPPGALETECSICGDFHHPIAGCRGPEGPPGIDASMNIGVPSPQSVTQIQATQLRWEYIDGGEIKERIEVWHEGQRLAASERSIGVVGQLGPA